MPDFPPKVSLFAHAIYFSGNLACEQRSFPEKRKHEQTGENSKESKTRSMCPMEPGTQCHQLSYCTY